MTDEQFKVLLTFFNDYRAKLDTIIAKLEEIRERQR